MHVLITGGCGFVGTNLVAKLNAIESIRVRVFDNESLGRREHLGNLKAEFVRGDLRDKDALAAALVGIDAVVHLAADTRVIDSIANPTFNFEVNVVGTLNLLEAMRARGIATLVNASTGGAIVGDVEPPVHEEMVPRPSAPYGAAKLAVEGYCSAYSQSYGFKTLSLRFSNVYGPRSYHKGSVVAAFYKRILNGQGLTVYGDGSQIRDFVYVEDLCDGIVAALRKGISGVIQLASGRPVTINALIDSMRSVVAPREIEVTYEPFRAGEIQATYCNIAKAHKELGYQASTSLTDGLTKTWAWFCEQNQTSAIAAPPRMRSRSNV